MSSETRHGPLSHLQLISAESITALYDYDNKILILKANGVHVDITTDITFHRLPFAGGLLFELHGWVGPIVHGESSYNITNKFSIELPSPALPSNTVVIETENKRWVVPIKPLLKDGPQDTQATPQAKAPANLPEVKVVPGNDEIKTGLGLPFTIKQSDKFKGEGGTVNIAFDPSYVTLDNAGIDNGNIEWTFTPQLVGGTEIAVFVGQTNPPFVYRVVYDVSIAPPNSETKSNPIVSFSVSPANGSSNGNGTKAAPKKNIVIPEPWDAVINSGYNLIKKQFPNADLYVVEARPATKKPVENEWGLVRNTIIARIDNNRHAIIKSIGWGEFDPVIVKNFPILGGDNISWPVRLDIHDAFGILRKEGYKDPVKDVTLRKPLLPEIDQAFYIFHIGDEFIAIGVDDRKIQPFGPTGQELKQA